MTRAWRESEPITTLWMKIHSQASREAGTRMDATHFNLAVRLAYAWMRHTLICPCAHWHLMTTSLTLMNEG